MRIRQKTPEVKVHLSPKLQQQDANAFFFILTFPTLAKSTLNALAVVKSSGKKGIFSTIYMSSCFHPRLDTFPKGVTLCHTSWCWPSVSQLSCFTG